MTSHENEKNDQHHDDEKTVTIVVDGTPHEVPKKEEITYIQVVALAYPEDANNADVSFSITYTKGHGNSPEGILAPGASVKVKKGMSFVVNRTGQS